MSPNNTVNYYEVLGVGEGASSEDLKKAYRSLMRKHHPDIAPGPENEEITRLASEAYGVLSDPEKRASYDLSLKEPSHNGEDFPEEEEEFVPSWGSEEEWVDEEVVEEPPPAPQPTPSFDEVFNQHFGSPPPPPQPTFTKAESIDPINVASEILDGDVKVKSNRGDLLAGLFAPFIALTITFFLSVHMYQMSFIIFVATIIGTVALFLKERERPRSSVLSWPFIGAFSAITGVVLWLLSGKISSQYGSLLFIASFAPAVAFISANTFWKAVMDRRVIKPKRLYKSNSFGEASGNPIDEMLEDSLNQLWSIPGLRMFRVRNQAFSHMIFFNGTLVLAKAAPLSFPGTLSLVGSNILLKGSNGMVAESIHGYGQSLNRFFANLSKSGLKVWPVVVGIPGQNFMGFEESGPIKIQGVGAGQAASTIAAILLKGETENIVRHDLILKAFAAAHS